MTLPVLFVDHGSPMEALAANAYTEALASVAADLAPRAIVCVSAHWETRGAVRVTASPRPPTIHDFGGFPDALYRLRYEAPGSAELAAQVAHRLRGAGIAAELDASRGLDHGAWVPLRHILPAADLPVVQVSLPRPRDARRCLAMGAALAGLRDEGVLLLGSGGIVHNIPLFVSGAFRRVMPQLVAFDRAIHARIVAGDAEALADYAALPDASLAVPTTEHFDPLLVAVGAASGLRARFLHGGADAGLSMNVVRFEAEEAESLRPGAGSPRPA